MLINDILKQLKQSISIAEYDKYISLMEYDQSSSRVDLEVFYVPNILVADWIEIHYKDIISKLFAEANGSGIQPDIHIKVKEKDENVKSLKNNKSVENFNQNSMTLNPSLTFSNLVRGQSNQRACAVADLVSTRQGTAYNPVFLYGPSGVGKTHLLNAIGNLALEQNKNVIYCTSENFLNEFMTKLRTRQMESFKYKYRKCDYFLLDDVQFIAGKEMLQEELLNTFVELRDKNKQIVIASDKPPKLIKNLEDRLKSRFEWGAMVEIHRPELEMKLAIIKSKSQANGISLDSETVHFIASHVHENVRQIEGILSNINLQLTINPQANPIKIAKDVIQKYQNENLSSVTVENIIKAVSREFNLRPSEITSSSRSKKIASARRIAIYLIRSMLNDSMPLIAKSLHMKDHSSVSKAIKVIEQEINENMATKALVENIRSSISTQ